MKIKTRILLSSTLTDLFSLHALLLIGTSVIGTWSLGLFNGERMSQTKAEKLVENLPADTTDFSELGSELEELGYNLYVFIPTTDETLYGGEGISVLVDVLDSQKLGSGKTYYIGKSTLITRRMSEKIVLAVNDTGGEKGGLRDLLLAFLIVGGIGIAVIISVGYIFTNNLAKHISRPLSSLVTGAGRIELGDLSQPINYSGSDEFKIVCDTFDRMQNHLKNERDKNAAYEKARTDLVSGISHDLRTPLTSVKGYIKGIQDGIANTPEKQQRYLQTAYTKANEMDMLLQKLFFFSKLETGNLPLNKQKIDIAHFIKNYAEHLSLEPRMHNITISANTDEECLDIMVDPDTMMRLLNNLTENAIKYSDAENLHLSIGAGRIDDDIVITFCDNGKGVPEDKLPLLFDQFWRGDSSRTQDGHSSGLGLYIVKYIVDSHGGSITAHSSGGLCFTIRLPALKEDQI
ncbi:MAG: HAMP domain-containing histidine kinase [Clostridia bacterium]|nr:HAMP domain-containing histidine kinase [Clostridia bacterium]